MTDQYVGEIRIFAGNYAPKDWAICNGTLLAIAGNETLFSVIGKTYGGDGINNFSLPDLRSRVPLHQGTGGGLTPRMIGSRIGAEQTTINLSQLPPHNHVFNADNIEAQHADIPGNTLAITPAGDNFYAPPSSDPTKQVTLRKDVIGTAGGDLPHDNRMPYLAVNFIIALKGVFPERQ